MNTKYSRSIAAAVVGLGMMAASGAALAQYGYAPPPYGYAPRAGDVPPHVERDFERRGYFDGVQGAQRDFQNHRVWDVNNRDEFRRPSVPWNVRGEYREGFRRGYYATVRQFEGARRWR
jgi:hypothetical protein